MKSLISGSYLSSLLNSFLHLANNRESYITNGLLRRSLIFVSEKLTNKHLVSMPRLLTSEFLAHCDYLNIGSEQMSHQR